jgi:hypothetical protein
MRQVAYIYLAEVSTAEVQEVFRIMEPWGFQITHIGKHDPPSKRRVDREQATEVVERCDGSGTNTTFVADARSEIELTFELRDDPRWGFSTSSISFPETIPARSLGEEVFRRLKPYAFICGEEGSGKEQQWKVVLTSEECPRKIRAMLAGET